MKTIRNNVFETNSSSNHCISLGNFDNTKEIPYVCFKLAKEDEFEGHGSGEVLSTIYDRAKYLWTTICCNVNFEQPDSFRIIDEFDEDSWWNERIICISFNEIKTLISNYLNDKCSFEDPNDITLNEDDHFYEYVSVNHQSNNSNGWVQKILSDKQLFLDYLLGKNSKVYLISDGVDEPENLNNNIMSDYEEDDENVSYKDIQNIRFNKAVEVNKKLRNIVNNLNVKSYVLTHKLSDTDRLIKILTINNNKLINEIKNLTYAIENLGEK